MRRSRSDAPPAIAGLISGVLAAVLLAGCLAGPGGPARTAVPPVQPTGGPVIDATRAEVERALRRAGLELTDASRPFRPPESPRMASAPRGVYRIVLRDPGQGHFVIYAFPDTRTAYDAARELAAYLGSGPGRIQFPSESRHVVRLVGPAVVVFTWSPAEAGDSRISDGAAALETVGQPIDVPR